MKNNKRKFISLLMAIVMAISMFSIPASAVEETTENAVVVSNRVVSGDILLKGGYLVNDQVKFTFTIPKSTTYIVDIQCQNISGNEGITAVLTNSSGASIFFKKVNTTYHQEHYLYAGTYVLVLSSSPYNCTYSAIISTK